MSTETSPAVQAILAAGLPTPKRTKIKWGDLRKKFSDIGARQQNREGTQKDWEIHEVKRELADRGFDDDAGPTPYAREGDKSLGDGNCRGEACAELAEEKPAIYGDRIFEVLIYPATTTDEQMAELANRAARSTNAFTSWDYHKQCMNLHKSNPGISQLDAIKRMGVKRIRTFFPMALRDEVLIDGPNGKEIKPGLTGEKVFAAGGNKQGPVQTGKALSLAHPRVVEAFFAGRTDPEHSVSYREVIEHNTAWELTKQLHPETAVGPMAFGEIAAKFPDAPLVKSLGPRLILGKQTQNGRQEGKGRMSKKETESLMNLDAEDPYALTLLHRIERNPGYVGEQFDRDVAELRGLVGRFVRNDPQCKAILERIYARAASAAKANAEAVAAREAAKAVKK